MTVYKEIVAEQRLTNIECTCVILRLSRRIICKLWLDNHSYVKLRNQWTNGKTLSTEALRRSLACFSFIQQIFQFAKHRYGDHCKLIAVLSYYWRQWHDNALITTLLQVACYEQLRCNIVWKFTIVALQTWTIFCLSATDVCSALQIPYRFISLTDSGAVAHSYMKCSNFIRGS